MIRHRISAVTHFILTLLCGAVFTVSSASAQTNAAQDIFSLIQSGNLAGAAQGLQTSIPATSGVSPTQIAQIVSNLSAGNAGGQLNATSAIGLISGLMGGNVSGQLGQALSGVANLGNISGTGGIASLLTNPQIGSLFSQITGGGAGAQQATQLLGTIMGLAANPQSLTQMASNPMSLISSLMGGGGGLGGLGNMISQALGGGGSNGAGGALGSIASAAGVGAPSSATQTAAAASTGQAAASAQQQQSTMNQNNPQITNNQQQGQPGSPSGPAQNGQGGGANGCQISWQGNRAKTTEILPFAADRNDHHHKGLDIMVQPYSPPPHPSVPTPAGCKVMMSSSNNPIWMQGTLCGSGYGKTARFDCCNATVEIRMAHLNGCDPKDGSWVEGKTGNACSLPDKAAHYHYELLIKNPSDGGFYAVDPICVWGDPTYKGMAKSDCSRVPGNGQGGAVNLGDRTIVDALLADAKAKQNKYSGSYHKGHSPTSMAFVPGQDPSAVIGNPQCNSDGEPAGGSDGGGQNGHTPSQVPEAPQTRTGDDIIAPPVDDPKPEVNESHCGKECCCPCTQPIIDDHNKREGLHGIRPYFDQCDGQGRDCEKPANESEESALKTHRDWLVYTFFQKQILPAMMLMTNQMTTVAMTQVAMIGSMLDAKHQLETQRLFQELQARAHKDYHPSEGMCDIGTNTRALAASDRRADLTQVTLSQRMISRGLISGTPLSMGGSVTDIQSRLKAYIKNYCNKADNGMNLAGLCTEGAPKERMNKDVDFTRTVDLPLTINADFTKDDTSNQPDAEDIFALSANLYGHEVSPVIKREVLGNSEGLVARDAAHRYLDVRAIMAKRSVAQNAFAAIAGMKTSGGTQAAENGPFIKKLVTELGVPEADIEAYLGKEPSYFAQMEVLSKKIYQNPVFFNELYDKPVNVDRKAAAIGAIDLMQDRDIYRSILRSEAMSAVILETMLMREQNKLINEINTMTQEGGR